MSAHECETMSHSKSTNRLQMLNPFWATKPGAGQASPAALPAGVSVSHHWALAPSSPHWPLFWLRTQWVGQGRRGFLLFLAQKWGWAALETVTTGISLPHTKPYKVPRPDPKLTCQHFPSPCGQRLRNSLTEFLSGKLQWQQCWGWQATYMLAGSYSHIFICLEITPNTHLRGTALVVCPWLTVSGSSLTFLLKFCCLREGGFFLIVNKAW